MLTSTLTIGPPPQAHPIHDHLTDLSAGPRVEAAVACTCGFRDHHTPGDDPTAFLTRSLRHLHIHHPEALDRPGNAHRL